MKKKPAGGAEAFEAFYSERFGERWKGLREALLEEPAPIGFSAYPPLGAQYFLDRASILAASVLARAFRSPSGDGGRLPIGEGGRVLDMCAAPGGKSLVLARALAGEGELVCNERSADRRSRLAKVLSEQLPLEWRARTRVTGHDAARWALFEREAYDAVLLDAPCSSERHILRSQAHLERWSPARVRNLAAAQWALLSCAFLLLKPEGYLLYSTCALAAEENDGVVDRLRKKYGEAALFPDADPFLSGGGPFLAEEGGSFPAPEKTASGFIVLPDSSGGAGPLYFSLISKA